MANGEATLLIRIKEAGAEILDKFVITLGDVIEIAGKIPDAIMAAVDAFKEEELAINQLTTAMINSGVYTQNLKADYLKMAEALQASTTFADDQIIASQALLQAQLGSTKITEGLMKATLDLAAAKKMDLTSAAELVGKTIGTETNALAKQGIEVDTTASKHEKLAQVINGINGKWKGQAEAMAQGLGVMDQLKNSWSDFLENAGAALAPFVAYLASATKSVLDFFNSMAGPNMGKMKVEEINAEVEKLNAKIEQVKKTAAMTGGLNAGDQAVIASLQKQIAAYDEFLKQVAEKEQSARDQAAAARAADAQKKKDEKLAQTQQEIMDQAVADQIKNDAELSAKVAHLNNIIATETDAKKRLKALQDKEAIEDKIRGQLKVKTQKELDDEMKKNRGDFLNQMASLQSANNKSLAAIGKAAAISMIWINTAEAASSGSKWGMAMGGPPLAAAFAGLAWAAGGAQAAKVAGVQLAEGGIVKARPGGIQATIGEGGQDEAVIPLDKAGSMGFGGGVTINFNGPLMGDQSQARELARAIDKELLNLRQTNQSQAFEGLI